MLFDSFFKLNTDINPESPDSYLLGHCIDGRVLFPATGYLVLAWRTLVKSLGLVLDTTPVRFEDVTIHRATILPRTGKALFKLSSSFNIIWLFELFLLMFTYYGYNSTQCNIEKYRCDHHSGLCQFACGMSSQIAGWIPHYSHSGRQRKGSVEKVHWKYSKDVRVLVFCKIV